MTVVGVETVFDAATAPKRESAYWRQGNVTWGTLCEWVRNPAPQKECGNYVLGILDETPDPKKGGQLTRRRNKRAIRTRGAVTLDADRATPDLPDTCEMLIPGAFIIHTTFSSTADSPRYRVIVPLDRPAAPDEYAAAALALMQMLGEDQFDAGSVEAWRYMFKPSAASPELYDYRIVEGPPSSLDDLIAGASFDYTDTAPPKSRNKRDPFTLEGLIGAFNRAYTIQEAIDAFELPYEEAGGGRWHYVGARSQAGLTTVSEGLVYSHHMNDPAGGQTSSAFDLVRLHRFGELDEGLSAQTPVNRRKSTEAMLDHVKDDPKVLAQIAEEAGADFDAWEEEVTDAVEDWRVLLKRNRKGAAEDSLKNWDLVRKHDAVMRTLFYNDLTSTIETTGPLPWRDVAKTGKAFTASDRVHLKFWLERELGFRPSGSLVEEQVVLAATAAWVNPVLAYLEGLSWDGVERLEECLPGVAPTEYTRMAARKAFVSAVARVMGPGCKVDTTLVLVGAEGLGKTYWIERMARGWSASLGKIGDKDTLMAMQRSWIVTADEGFSLKKSDSDAMKEFLTRTEDVIRRPYDKESVAIPRRCVIWATTNDDTFLRRQDGNRRFLIVECAERVDFSAMTDEYIGQVWAEAVHRYRNGERLYLDAAETESAVEERERFTEEDALTGLVQTYLDTLVPDSWGDMSIDARLSWMQARSDDLVQEGSEPIRSVCSIQVWCEVMGQRRGDFGRPQSLEVTKVLKVLPGWTYVGLRRTGPYGPQRVYERDVDPLELL